ncbi:hypothetical protein, partial [Planktotalea sp.]|uniref:hypothetical protein n=1 Tax=Planktotalea sp. TaxID=2029877 RepID=UPI003D6A6861
PSFVDLDGDGDLNMVVGEYNGTLKSFENTTAHGQTITVNVAPEAEVPTLANLASSVSFAENTVNETPQLLDMDVSFGHTSAGDFDGGSLSLTGLLAEDTVSVRDQGTGVGEIGLSGADVTFEGTVIGTLAGGAGTALTITFNAAATSASIDALIQNLTYANSSDTPTSSRDLLLNVTDAAGGDLGPAPGMQSLSELTGGANPFDGIDVGTANTPSFVDLDGDGDLDMVVGENYGVLHVFDNNDADAGFTELTGGASPLHGISVGAYSTPSFVDLDGD